MDSNPQTISPLSLVNILTLRYDPTINPNLPKKNFQDFSPTEQPNIKSIEKSIPANRFATPDEIANLVAFLASKEAAYVNGVNLNIDGSLIKGY